jgi:biotin carboxylase
VRQNTFHSCLCKSPRTIAEVGRAASCSQFCKRLLKTELELYPTNERGYSWDAVSRVLLLLPTTTYRTKAFVDAASKLGIDVVAATEEPSTLQSKNPGSLITLNFLDPDRAAESVGAFAAQHPIYAVIPVDEDTAVAAARINQQIGLPGNPVQAAMRAKNKALMREALSSAGVPVPRFWQFSLDDEPAEAARRVAYPCVVKPTFLSTSRGVMRADNPNQFVDAVLRLQSILASPQIARRGGEHARQALAEEFIPGVEIALEGLLTDGALRVLTVFDKPDPLDGPFFEETIYVTPSRLQPGMLEEVFQTTAAATEALGLVRGPVHAELRINQAGPWVIEVAARSIGGLCSRALRFEGDRSLEEVILMHALGQDTRSIHRDSLAAGVMMIPIPQAGILTAVHGIKRARDTADIEDIVISAHIGQEVRPPPEGAAYLGFIFSRATDAGRAEAALREAHRLIEFVIQP